MRHTPNLRIEQFRQAHPVLGWSEPGENYGYFEVPYRGHTLRIIASDGTLEDKWEHVSVSLPGRCPTWDEMAKVKELFWADDETVVQFHPKRSSHINQMPYCLHLWKQRGHEWELPPGILIGTEEPSP